MALVSARMRRPLSWALIAVAVALQVAQLRTGQAVSISAFAQAVATSAAAVQGMGLVAQRRKPVLAALAISIGYLTQVVAVGVVPGYVGWLAISLSPRLDAGPGRRARVVALGAISASLAVGVVAAAVIHGDSGSTVPTLLLIEAVVLLGTGLSWARSARAQALARAAEDARLRLLAEERLRIARDLHDMVGHGLSTIAVQSSTARMAIDAGSLADARAAVAAVEAGSRDAMREMRQVLGVLRQGRRDQAEQTAPAPGLRDLPTLIERVRSTGVDVISEEVPLPPETVPADVQLAAFHIVQESLTNIIRHAPGSAAHVAIRLERRSLHIEVLDSGEVETTTRGARLNQAPGKGVGVMGMRERAEFLGGYLTAGPRSPERGWRVSASLPLPRH
jgi:signal transduction histidine kinase